MATCIFPDDERDVEAAILLSKLEGDWFRRYGKKFKAGSISNAISKLYGQRVSQQIVCGSVALVLMENARTGSKKGLNGAAKTVSEAAYIHKTGTWVDFDEGQPRTIKVRLTADHADVKKVFRTYQSVAHICAARLVSTDYFSDDDVKEVDHPDAQRFIKTVAIFQERLANLEGYSRWDLWNVAGEVPASLKNVPHFEPTPELLESLFNPRAS